MALWAWVSFNALCWLLSQPLLTHLEFGLAFRLFLRSWNASLRFCNFNLLRNNWPLSTSFFSCNGFLQHHFLLSDQFGFFHNRRLICFQRFWDNFRCSFGRWFRNRLSFGGEFWDSLFYFLNRLGLCFDWRFAGWFRSSLYNLDFFTFLYNWNFGRRFFIGFLFCDRLLFLRFQISLLCDFWCSLSNCLCFKYTFTNNC